MFALVRKPLQKGLKSHKTFEDDKLYHRVGLFRLVIGSLSILIEQLGDYLDVDHILLQGFKLMNAFVSFDIETDINNTLFYASIQT